MIIIDKSPIFIVGYMHSGTTMLKDIVGNHSEVFTGQGESKLFEFLPQIQQRFSKLEDTNVLQNLIDFIARAIIYGYRLDYSQHSSQELGPGFSPKETNELVRQSRGLRHNELISFVFNVLMTKAGKKRWLEKTPSHIFYADLIIDSIPKAKLVEIVRDPRSILASKKVRRQIVFSNRYSEEQKKFKNYEKGYDPFWDLLSWKSAIQSGITAHDKYLKNIIRIRYEDLVLNPELEIKNLCRFLALPYSPEMMNIGTKTTGYADIKSNMGITTEFTNKWKSTLDNTEVWLIQFLCSHEMKMINYKKVKIGLFPVLYIPILIARSFFEFFLRLYRRYRMSGKGFFVKVVRNYYERLKVLLKIDI